MRKVLLSLVVVVLVGGIALFFWARAVFTQDSVRSALAAQLSQALGQPVAVGSIAAAVYPRVTVTLGDVTIGQPAGISIATLHVGTDFRALLSRRIEHASARVDGARISLPLLPLGSASPAPAPSGPPGAPPVTLVSIDEIVLSNVEVASTGHTLRGDVEIVPESSGGFTVRKLSLAADDARFEATGHIADVSRPAGELSITAGELNLDRLLGFLGEMSGAAGGRSTNRPAQPGSLEPDLRVGITATRATLAGVALDAVSANAHVTARWLTLQLVAFGTFGGKYEGALSLLTGTTGPPRFLIKGSLTNIDVPAVTRFAGSQSDPITGRLAAQLELAGAGTDVSAALSALRGTARVVLRDGIVRNLGLVRAIVVATSMRGASSTIAGASAAASKEAATARDEPFRTLSATLSIAGMEATTNDLQFVGNDVDIAAHWSLALTGRRVDLDGRVQLSDALTARAGTDLVRYTRENGRVTLPVSVSGPAEALSVSIDAGQLLQRAIRNRAEEEVKKTIMKGLGGLFKKPPK